VTGAYRSVARDSRSSESAHRGSAGFGVAADDTYVYWTTENADAAVLVGHVAHGGHAGADEQREISIV
jgi:hypothetical protein